MQAYNYNKYPAPLLGTIRNELNSKIKFFRRSSSFPKQSLPTRSAAVPPPPQNIEVSLRRNGFNLSNKLVDAVIEKSPYLQFVG